MRNSLVLLYLLLVLMGCEIFKPREAEPPESVSEWFSFHITPYQTMNNLKFAYLYSGNLEKYSSILHKDFIFYFDVRDVNDYNIQSDWNRDYEIEMLYIFHNSIQGEIFTSIDFYESEDQTDQIQLDEAWVFRSYMINIHQNEQNDNILSSFEGKFELKMKKDTNGFWKIKEWRDYRLSIDSNSWGKLKNDYSP